MAAQVVILISNILAIFLRLHFVSLLRFLHFPLLFWFRLCSRFLVLLSDPFPLVLGLPALVLVLILLSLVLHYYVGFIC